MKQFFSVLFFFVSGLAFAQDVVDININPPVKMNIPAGQNVSTPYESDFALLYDNGPMITHPLGGAGGSDVSALQSALSMSIYGLGAQISVTLNNAVADDFTITGTGWNIEEMVFYTYQTSSGTTSTITDLRIQIYNGPPDAGGTVVWGDMTTNRLTSTSWTNIYRVLDTDLLNTQRPIMRTVAQFSPALNLAPGTYWVEFQWGGTLTSGPWAPPVTILTQTTTGNALQRIAATWGPAMDTGSGTQQGMPFQIFGTENINTPVLVSPANNSTEVPTNLQLVWQDAAGAENYRIQVSLSSDFNTATFEIGSITGISFSVSGLAENTKYYWRVRGESGVAAGSWSEVWNYKTVQNLNLNYTITFPTKDKAKDYQSSDYKIVGLPGNSDLDVKSILSGQQETDWQVYWDNGQDITYYNKYDGSDAFRFWIGSSFWIIRKGNLNISRTCKSTSLSPNGCVGIALSDGFNLITNPYPVSVNWADVQTINGGIVEVIKTYNKGWSNSDKLEPYLGYLIDNRAVGLVYLQIPHPFFYRIPLEKKTDVAIWRVEVELNCEEFIDKTTSFGVSAEALEGRDKFDLRKPRGMGNTPFVYFYHPNWDNGYGLFETDIRPQFEEQQTWDLKVYSELREPEKLKFSGMEGIPGDLEIYLIDVDRARYINLRNQDEYEFSAAKTISEFQILVGKQEVINTKLDELVPTEFELGNNFPNPFNPTTTIPLSIPQTADIRLIIYNILGQEVRALYDGTLEAGKYWYQWDGRDNMGQAVPSSIYLYNFVSSNGINFSKKMVLLK